MRYTARLSAALGLVAVVAVAGTAIATPADRGGDPVAASAKERSERRPGGPLGKRMVTGEFKVQTADGFATVRIDQGTVTSVEGQTLTLKRADGESVSVTAADDTRIRRNGEEARLSDLKPGDLVRVMQRDTGDGFTVHAIRARSADWTPPPGRRRGERPRAGARPAFGTPPFDLGDAA